MRVYLFFVPEEHFNVSFYDPAVLLFKMYSFSKCILNLRAAVFTHADRIVPNLTLKVKTPLKLVNLTRREKSSDMIPLLNITTMSGAHGDFLYADARREEIIRQTLINRGSNHTGQGGDLRKEEG